MINFIKSLFRKKVVVKEGKGIDYFFAIELDPEKKYILFVDPLKVNIDDLLIDEGSRRIGENVIIVRKE